MKIKRAGITLLAICLAVSFLFSGCTGNKPMSAEEFCVALEDKGYSVVDVKEQFSEFEHIKYAYVAIDSENSYQIEFYETGSVSEARGMFESNVSKVKSSKGNGGAVTSSSAGNHAKYRQSYNSEYWVVAYISNTLVYVHTDENYKDTVDELLKSIGY